MQEHQARLESLSQLAAQLAGRQETVIREQLESVRRRHVALGQQLLHLVRQVGGLSVWVCGWLNGLATGLAGWVKGVWLEGWLTG